MTRTLSALPLAFALATAAPALAQDVPPEGALPLSEIILALEDSQPLRVFTEVDWDSDGYWEIEYVDNDNREVEVRIDPATGAIIPR